MKSVSTVLYRIQSRINVSLANAVILCSAGRGCRAAGGARTGGRHEAVQLRHSRALIVFKYNAIKMKVQIMLHQHQRQQYNQPTAGTSAASEQEWAGMGWRLSWLLGQMAGVLACPSGRQGVKGCCVAGSADNSMSCSICLHANVPRLGASRRGGTQLPQSGWAAGLDLGVGLGVQARCSLVTQVHSDGRTPARKEGQSFCLQLQCKKRSWRPLPSTSCPV